MIHKIVDNREYHAILVVKATTSKGKAMADEKRGHSRSPNLKQYYIQTDGEFHRRLKVAAALEGEDMAVFLRKSAEIRICVAFAAKDGSQTTESDT